MGEEGWCFLWSSHCKDSICVKGYLTSTCRMAFTFDVVDVTLRGAAGLPGWDVLGIGVYRSVVPILHAWLFHRPVHWSHCGGLLWVVMTRKVKECFKWRRQDWESLVWVLCRTQVLLKHIFLAFCRKWRMFLNIFACWCTYPCTSPQTG